MEHKSVAEPLPFMLPLDRVGDWALLPGCGVVEPELFALLVVLERLSRASDKCWERCGRGMFTGDLYPAVCLLEPPTETRLACHELSHYQSMPAVALCFDVRRKCPGWS